MRSWILSWYDRSREVKAFKSWDQATDYAHSLFSAECAGEPDVIFATAGDITLNKIVVGRIVQVDIPVS